MRQGRKKHNNQQQPMLYTIDEWLNQLDTTNITCAGMQGGMFGYGGTMYEGSMWNEIQNL